MGGGVVMCCADAVEKTTDIDVEFFLSAGVWIVVLRASLQRPLDFSCDCDSNPDSSSSLCTLQDLWSSDR